MQVNITFRNMFATDALRNHVQDKLGKVVDKYLDKVTEAHVTLSVERYLHHADVNLHAGHFHVRGKEKSEDMYASIDMAIDKIERQLKKHKERLKNHRPAHIHQHGPVRVRYEVFSTRDEELGMAPEVLRSDEFLAKPMSVEEALMQMDLLNNDFLVFTRPESSDVNVIYRRKDGNFGLIAPGGQSVLAALSAPRRAQAAK
ncbi:MAG: ribosome-associated translation inhibitor RaiA [Deltaproteobacteria bacterium]|nr:MAG: ribosome-associated translation inhibitor RaiA [Deltaproteobacteria bacterium]